MLGLHVKKKPRFSVIIEAGQELLIRTRVNNLTKKTQGRRSKIYHAFHRRLKSQISLYHVVKVTDSEVLPT